MVGEEVGEVVGEVVGVVVGEEIGLLWNNKGDGSGRGHTGCVCGVGM